MKSGMKHDVLSGLWSFSRCLPQGMLVLNRQVPIQSFGIWYPLKTVAGSECQCCAAGITQGRAIVLPVSTCLFHTKLRIDEQAGCRWFFCCEVHDFQDGVCGARSIHEDSNFNCARVDGIALFLESSFPQKVSCLAVSSVNSDEYFPAASAAVSYVASISKSRKWRLSIVAPCCFQNQVLYRGGLQAGAANVQRRRHQYWLEISGRESRWFWLWSLPRPIRDILEDVEEINAFNF